MHRAFLGLKLVHLNVQSTFYLLFSVVNVIGNLFKCHQCKRRMYAVTEFEV